MGGGWSSRSSQGLPHPESAAACQTPGSRHLCRSLLCQFLRGPNPIALSSTPAPPAALANLLKGVTPTWVSTGNVDAALTSPFPHRLTPTDHCYQSCPLYHDISPSLHFSPSYWSYQKVKSPPFLPGPQLPRNIPLLYSTCNQQVS